MEDWGTWLQQVGGGLLDKWGTAEYVQPYEIQKMQLAALGNLGYYVEGRTGVIRQAGAVSPVNSTLLLAGGAALLLFLLVKD